MKHKTLFVALFFPILLYAQTFEEWKKRAENGDIKAMHQMGRFYDIGDSVPLDYTMAVKWYRLAAEQG